MKNYDDILKIIVANPNAAIELLNKELSMPNIPTPTMGGEVLQNSTGGNCNKI